MEAWLMNGQTGRGLQRADEQAGRRMDERTGGRAAQATIAQSMIAAC